MKFFSTKIGSILFGVFFLVGCSARQPVMTLPVFDLTPFDSDQYVSSVDNFLIILDSSSSMDKTYMGNKKFTMATQIVSRLNQALPELGQNAGLRSFGHSPMVSDKSTILFYGMEPYNTKALDEKLKLISTPGGISAMQAALTQAGQDLKGVSGKTAVVIISDGQKRVGLESSDTMKAAQALKDQLGPGLCFYPVLVGADPEGGSFMEEIARISTCGFVSGADTLLTDTGMAQFVKEVFLTQKPMAPAKAAPVIEGLNEKGAWVVEEAFFDFDKSVVKSGAFDLLGKIAGILKANPELNVLIQGHTDSVGSKAYNNALSLKRAQAVKNYLMDQGIESRRLICEGFGFSKPAASNKTKQGRALNRRVEIYPVK